MAMTFPDTMNIVSGGNKAARFRRPSWGEGKYVSWFVNSENNDHVNPTVLLDDFVADDWEVIE